MSRERPSGPIRWEVQAKPGGGVRTLARLDPRDACTYRGLVARNTATITRALGACSFANRTEPGGRPRSLASGRARWRRAILHAVVEARSGIAIVSDVRDCYPSIGPSALRRTGLQDEELFAFLRGLWGSGVHGLPVGPPPSAMLADGVLAHADRAAAAAGVVPIRWVDDVILLSDDPARTGRAFDAWRRALGEVGLEAHEDKTHRMPAIELTHPPAPSGSSLDRARARAIIASP